MSVPLKPTDERYGRFRNTGDGARIAIPNLSELADLNYPQELKPTKLTKQTCRNLIDQFLLVGHSNHSDRGMTLWPFFLWAKDTGVSLNIQRHYALHSGAPLKSIGYTVSLPKPRK